MISIMGPRRPANGMGSLPRQCRLRVRGPGPASISVVGWRDPGSFACSEDADRASLRQSGMPLNSVADEAGGADAAASLVRRGWGRRHAGFLRNGRVVSNRR
jgi:hypothetical protein